MRLHLKSSWLNFLLCLLLSTSVWAIYNLSQEYSEIEDVVVMPSSNIEGRAQFASTEVTVTARCKASGWTLIKLGRDKKTHKVFFDSRDIKHVSGDNFVISSSSLDKYTGALFGDGVTVDSYVTDGVKVVFIQENSKRVPVLPEYNATFKSQYMARGLMKTTPDSVTVYGEEQRLAGIESVRTKPLHFKDIRSSQHGEVKLEAPSGLRISHDKVAYSLEVNRFVEMRERVTIGTHNVPANTHLTVMPSTAEVVYKCIFPVASNPVDRAEFYVDYRDFVKSRGGQCIIRTAGLPDGVIEVRIDPEYCECVAN